MTEVDSPISIISSATYRGVTSPGAIASGFGHSLGTGPQSSSIPVPTLFGTTATLTDSSMAVRQVLMYYASPSQLNFVVPSAAALGTALLSVTSNNGKVSTGQIQIANVAPGLYAADGSGSGPPAGFAAESSAPSQLNALFQCDPASGRCITQPLDVPTDGSALYLILFGTGIQRGASGTTATAGGISLGVSYSGPQPQFPGLDQINLRIPDGFQPRGTMDLQIMVNGISANPVKVTLN